MRALTDTEIMLISGGAEFSFSDMAGAVAAGAVVGAMGGSLIGGVGAGPGALAGGATGGTAYVVNIIVSNAFSSGGTRGN